MKKKITNIPISLFEIEEDGFHLFIEAEVNGNKALLLVDTGASKTVFDKTKIIQLLGLNQEEPEFEPSPHLSAGLGTNTMESNLVTLDRLQIGDLVLTDFEAVVLDINHVNISYDMLGHSGIDGVLGSDILKLYDAVIYYKKKMLKLYF